MKTALTAVALALSLGLAGVASPVDAQSGGYRGGRRLHAVPEAVAIAVARLRAAATAAAPSGRWVLRWRLSGWPHCGGYPAVAGLRLVTAGWRGYGLGAPTLAARLGLGRLGLGRLGLGVGWGWGVGWNPGWAGAPGYWGWSVGAPIVVGPPDSLGLGSSARTDRLRRA